jgi:cation transport ATPase
VSRFRFLLQAGLLAGWMDRALADGPGFNTGIEGMDSQQWSVGIFVFLIFCILVFMVIVLKFMTSDKVAGLKRGEKVMFAWIILGVIAAVIIGAMQLLQGRLL